MSYFGFEYFCGANVLVRIEDMPVLEATGLSLTIQESKRPIYGYSSRHFDAVASGQVLVQGQLIINYVHQDYLWHAIRAGLGIPETPVEEAAPLFSNEDMQDYMSYMGQNDDQDAQVITSLKNRFWLPSASGASPLAGTRNPHDAFGGLNLRVTFGEQDLGLKNSGKTGLLVTDVYFLGRSNVINISEDVIVEAYPFIARDIYSLNTNSYRATTSSNPFDPSTGQSITLRGNT